MRRWVPGTCCPVSIGGSSGFVRVAVSAKAPTSRRRHSCVTLASRNSVHKCPKTTPRGRFRRSVYTPASPRPRARPSRVATVYTNDPKQLREAISTNLCTLLRSPGLARDHGALVYDLQAERPIDVCPLPGGAAPIASPLARASPAWSSTGYRRGPAGHRSALAPSWWEASTIKSDMKAGCKPAELPGRGPRRAGRGRPQGAGLHGAGDASRGSWTRTTRCAQRVGGLWPHPFRTPCPLCHLFAIKLAVVERCVPASCGDKLLVRALLYHVSALHVENEVRVADG